VTTPTRGFIYAATGEKWVRESVTAAAELRRVHPDIPSVLFTDQSFVDETRTAFDEVIALPERTWVRSESKLWGVAHSPFERTVFLDTDTHVRADISDLFNVLERFDFAGVPVPTRNFRRPRHSDPSDIPNAFQCPNGGVLAFRRNDATKELFELWWDLYHADLEKATKRGIMDQPSLRVSLWRSNCSMLVLPPEFNMRTLHHRSRPTIAVGPVRIIHGRPPDVDKLERRWNRTETPRMLTPIVQFQLRQAWRAAPRKLIPRNTRAWKATAKLRDRFTGR